MADPYSYNPPSLDDELGSDENIKMGLGGLISPASAQSLVMPPPSTPPQTAAAQTTPQTGSLSTAPSQAHPKVSGAPMIPGVATKPENLQNQLSQDQGEYNRLASSGAGVDQVKNRWGRVLGKIADVAGSVLAPGVAQFTPGSTLNHQRLLGQAQARVGADEAQQQSAAALADTQSQIQQRQAVASQNAARAQSEQPRAVTQAEATAAGRPDLVGSVQRPADIQRLIDARKATYGKDQIISGVDGAQYRIDPLNPTVAQPITGPNGKPIMGAPKVPAQPKISDEDRYIQIMSKPPAQRTAEDNAWIAGERQFNKENRIDPGVQRAEIFVGGRAVQTLDPSDPTRVVYQTANQAERNGSSAPASIDFQTQKGVSRDFTSGPDARTVTAYNTAQQHLAQLGQAADALQNGNLQLANRVGQAYAEQTGNPAPTNFDAVKSAVAGEVSKVFKSSGATDAEIRTISNTISKQNSPDQLKGVIQQYSHLLDSKRQALQQQYTQGMQSQPNFGNQNAPNQGPNLGTINYTVNGTPYRIPREKAARFEKEFPNAKRVQ